MRGILWSPTPIRILFIKTEAKLLSFNPDFYEGRIIEHLSNGRDKIMLPGPCYRTDMRIHHGASGGPVACGMKGKVFAINSTGIDGTSDFYISKIDAILELKIKVEGNQGEEEATIKELADRGSVTIDE